MKYFLDTEFIEGTQGKFFGKTKPTIDLISIGIVGEDGREYYSISKEFNLREAWNRWQYDMSLVSGTNQQGKLYWIRDNVLKPIFRDLVNKEYLYANQAMYRCNVVIKTKEYKFCYRDFKFLLNKYGKTNKQIAKDVLYFCSNGYFDDTNLELKEAREYDLYDRFKPEFYGYYADYDWVVFCWLFGLMIDLPKGFPVYCNDLKQTIDSICMHQEDKYEGLSRLEAWNKDIKTIEGYPKQQNEHNALADAKWNFELYKFLNTIK